MVAARKGIMWVINKVLSVFIRLAKKLKSNKFLYNLAYAEGNANGFSRFYEHEKMLADTVRVDTYAAAIDRHVKAGDVVVDLGTGTGILAMFAARRGKKVYAIDHSDIITVAEKIARHNGFDNIEFVRINSQSFVCPEKVDVIVHEQIGDYLFNENMVDNLLDLKQRVLKDTGKILPGCFELFMEPVSMKSDHRAPFIYEIETHGIKFDVTRDLPELDKANKNPRHYAEYGRHYAESGSFDFFLSEPQSILTVDLNENDESDYQSITIDVSREVVRPGRMDGIFMFFRVVFDDETYFDTAPYNPNTSWANWLFRLPSREYAAGESINYTVKIDDIRDSFTWTVEVE